MKDIEVDMDILDVKDKLKKVKKIPNGTTTVLKKALNKTGTSIKTDAAKQISSRYTISKDKVKEQLKDHKATNSQLYIEVSSKGRPVRLIHFEHTPNQSPGVAGSAGVFSKVKKKSAGGFIKENLGGKLAKGFIANMADNAQPAIFVRTGRYEKPKKGRYKGGFFSKKKREVLRQAYAPGVAQMLNNDNVMQNISEKASKNFDKKMNKEIEKLLK